MLPSGSIKHLKHLSTKPPVRLNLPGHNTFTEHLTELAQDVMESVIQGPEVETLFATFQIADQSDDGDTVDIDAEAELAAQLE